MTIPAPNTSLAAMINLVRKLTASPSNASLAESEIVNSINLFYLSDMPNDVKTDQLRNVYTFFTEPFVGEYALDINFNQSVRGPFYVDGVQGTLLKDRTQFYRLWPEFINQYTPASGDGTTQAYSFTIPSIPIYQNTVTIGSVDTTGRGIMVTDDGKGNLYYMNVNPVVSIPEVAQTLAQTTYPGQYNRNTGNPGLNNTILVGSVNYVTGVTAINLALAGVTPAASRPILVKCAPYQPCRPNTMLFFNNKLILRPCPDSVYRVEVETYLMPVQFLNNTDVPLVSQWFQYLALGASLIILRNRQDTAGIQNLMPFFEQQKALVLSRQASEEIGKNTFNNAFYGWSGANTQDPYGWWGW